MDSRADKKRNQDLKHKSIKQKRWIENICRKKDVLHLSVQDDIRIINSTTGRGQTFRHNHFDGGKLETIVENDYSSRRENKWWIQRHTNMKERIKEHEKKRQQSKSIEKV